MPHELCEALEKLLGDLERLNFSVTEIKLSDYHFKEYHVRVKGNIDEVMYDHNLFEHKGNKLLCKCHWSVVEFMV